MSGFLVQGRHGSRGNFEVVTPLSHGDGLAHFWRDNDAADLPWFGPTCFGSGRVQAASLIQSNYGAIGNLELVANEGGRLAFYWRQDGPPWSWSGPFDLGAPIRGNPSLIQSRHGSKGNFEVVGGHPEGGLFHMWRNNDVGSLPWSGQTRFGRGRVDGVALVQGNFGRTGNLELIVNEAGRLAFYWRQDAPPWTWSGPFYLADGVRGTPALIQSRHGRRGNLEVIAAHSDGGLIHMWRDNDVPAMPWSAPSRFGTGTVDEVSLIQGNFGTVGNLEIVTREAGQLRFYWRIDGPPWTFSGPSLVGSNRTATWTECVYTGRTGYFQADTHIVVRIQLNPDSGISAATMNNLRATWRNGIIDKWSDRFDCRAPNGQRRRITFDVEWVTANPHHVVRVQPGPAQSNESLWDTSDSGDVASHEFGHMLGNPDEYQSATCPARSPVSTGTVMDDNTEAVARHLSGIASFHCGHTSVARPSPIQPLRRATLRVKLYEQLSEEDQERFAARLHSVGLGKAPTRLARASEVRLIVSGGPPTERYESELVVRGDGRAHARILDELRGLTAETPVGVDAASVSRVFEAATAGSLLRLARVPKPIVPDQLVATLTITDGDAVKSVHVPVTEESALRAADRRRMVALPTDQRMHVPRVAAKELLATLDALAAVGSAVRE